jgi:hypothetical protein
MRIRDFLTKISKILPFIAFTVAIDSNMMARDNQKARLEGATKVHNQLLEQLRATQETIISDENVRNRLAGLSADALDSSNTAKYHGEQMNSILSKLAEKLKDPNLDQGQVDYINGLLQHHFDQTFAALNKSNSTLQDILEKIASSSSGSSSNNFVDSFNSLLENYKSFLSTLNVEQLNAIVNFWGLIFLVACLISIAAIFYGDYLIKYFNLEVKYPRLAKFIQLRRKFQLFYLNLNFLAVLLMALYLIWFNFKCIFDLF